MLFAIKKCFDLGFAAVAKLSFPGTQMVGSCFFLLSLKGAFSLPTRRAVGPWVVIFIGGLFLNTTFDAVGLFKMGLYDLSS